MIQRRVTAADLPTLLRFERQYMRDFEPAGLPGWTAAIDRNLALWIACFPTSVALTARDGALAGVALWTIDARVATLVSVHVRPDVRRSGFGGALIDAFVDAATAAGATTAALGVHEASPGAERLYVSHGFRPRGTDGDYRLYERDLTTEH